MAAVQKNSLNLLSAYNDSDEDSSQNNSTNEDSTNKKEGEESRPHDYELYKPVDSSVSVASSIQIDAAPVVLYSVSYFN
jgi:hypothetical protein